MARGARPGDATSTFSDLQRLAGWFVGRQRDVRFERIVALARRLGATAVPLLGRELRTLDPQRREAARDLLAAIATDDTARERVIAELRAIISGPDADEAKVVALGLLGELGEPGEALFSDPTAIRRRSALALAAQLETPADVAHAADLMIRQLDADDMLQMLEVMADVSPVPARRLVGELAARLDLPAEVREQLAAIARCEPPCAPCDPGPQSKSARRGAAQQFAVLVDPCARLVVIACRRHAARGQRHGWRRWAVLIGATGRIDDCLHEDDAGPDGDATALIAHLCADGYRVASTERDHARTVVAAAARLTAEATPLALPSPYYLGRDLLDLRDAHLGGRAPLDLAAAMLARAVELVAAGDHARALPLLERCDPANAEAAAALAAVHLATGRPADALAPLERAITAEPDWPLHHWNLACALHQLADTHGCYRALRRFIATSGKPTGLYADPDQPGRVGSALRLIADLERTARLTGTSLRRRRRRGQRA